VDTSSASTTRRETGAEPLNLVVVNAGISDPSSSRLLADRIVAGAVASLGRSVGAARATYIELAPLAIDISQAMVAGFPNKRLSDAIETLAGADAIIASTPVYKAGMSGLFKSFVDILDNDLLIGTPVIVAATGGTARHAMVPDEQMRPLFAFMRAVVVPTSVYVAPEDWSDPELARRIDRAATELAFLVKAGEETSMGQEKWSSYQHQFGSAADGADVGKVDFNTSLMRLASGQPPCPRTTVRAVRHRSTWL
jgi:FMN reductase